MPQNTPMKRQFTTIDGRTVMSNLPQHWGGNDWKITGVDNPLPVGNYVQTEAGVWVPQKGSDDGAADVRLTGNNVVELITPRGVFKETKWGLVDVPDFAKGVIAVYVIRGVTGTFSSGEGFYTQTRYNSNGVSLPIGLQSELSTSPSLFVHVISQSVNLIDNSKVGIAGELRVTSMPLPKRMEFNLRVQGGIFGDGEGIDGEVFVEWIV